MYDAVICSHYTVFYTRGARQYGKYRENPEPCSALLRPGITRCLRPFGVRGLLDHADAVNQAVEDADE